jgi:hypothetical protein
VQKSKLEAAVAVNGMSRYVTVLAIAPTAVHGVMLIGQNQSAKVGLPHKFGKLNKL